MPMPPPIPVASDETLPKSADVVVIGGGIIGAMTALELAQRGQRVVLCEKGIIAGEQSSRNWGWVRISHRDPREIPLMHASVQMWKTMDKRLGHATGYRQTGIVFHCNTAQKAQNYTNWMRHLEPYQHRIEMLTNAQLADKFPGVDLGGHGALYTPDDGRAEPQLATSAIAHAARDAGTQIFTNCAVRSLDMAAGRVAGVVTERGRIATSNVVLAGGAWSNLFAGNLGLTLPQLLVHSHVLRTAPIKDGPEGAVWTANFALRKRDDGGYTISRGSGNTVDIVPNTLRYMWAFMPALRLQHRDLHLRFGRPFFEALRQPRRWKPDDITPFERMRILDPIPSGRFLDSLLDDVARVFPAFNGAEIAQKWAGCIDVTPDAILVISNVDAIPGLTIGTGFSGHGFGIGPGAGRLLADIVTGQTPVVDPTPFRFSRFTDGSRVAPDDGF